VNGATFLRIGVNAKFHNGILKHTIRHSVGLLNGRRNPWWVRPSIPATLQARACGWCGSLKARFLLSEVTRTDGLRG
jgi:hypothetical protein